VTGADRSAADDVVIVGGGAIGAAIGWRAAQRGLGVTVVDPGDHRGAWHTAAGMLAPVTELHYTETALLRLNLDSLARYPSFCAELADASGLPTGLRACGTVSVAWDGADLAGLRDLQAFASSLGVTARMLGGRELRQLEPALAPGLPGGMLAESDHQIDPRLLHDALVAAARALGVRFRTGTAQVQLRGGRAVGVLVGDDRPLAAASVVLAAGAWSASDVGLPAELCPPVRPVKGQTLRLRLPGPPRIGRTVRASVKGAPVYVVPRMDGEYVVGGSSEETGFAQRARAGAVYELLRDAQSVLPDLAEATLDEVCTGLRPGSPDNAPLIGPSAIDGLVLATGHYRNGILLTPVTADGVADYLTSGTLPDVLGPFTPQRLQQPRAVSA
jgi:glycine oxidase